MIKPTVGRQVWFWGGQRYDESQPEAATVTYVHNDRMVSLQVLEHSGIARPVIAVPLLQDGDPRPASGFFAEWMPYQKGQAAKTDELARAIATGQPGKPVDER